MTGGTDFESERVEKLLKEIEGKAGVKRQEVSLWLKMEELMEDDQGSD